jgi:hypothetical protein
MVTTSNYNALPNSCTLQFTAILTKCFQSAVSSPVVVWQRLPKADVPLTLTFRTIPIPKLPVSNINGSRQLNCSSPLMDWSPITSLHSTVFYCTHWLNWTRSVESYILGADSSENAVCSTSSIASLRHRVRDAFFCCVCTDHYLTKDLHATLLHP